MNTMLIVDDEEMIQQLLRDEFELEGFDVKTASSGNAAIALIENGFKPDIIITDMLMPDGTGVDLLKYLAKQQGYSPIVFILSAFLDSLHDEVNLYATAGIISKPFDRDLLFKQIGIALQKKSGGIPPST